MLSDDTPFCAPSHDATGNHVTVRYRSSRRGRPMPDDAHLQSSMRQQRSRGVRGIRLAALSGLLAVPILLLGGNVTDTSAAYRSHAAPQDGPRLAGSLGPARIRSAAEPK